MARPSGQIKQRTVDGTTITLHQLKNDFQELSNNKYMYEVRLNGAPVGDPVFTRAAGEEQFRLVVKGENTEPAQQDQRRQRGHGSQFGMGGGLFGGGGWF